MTGFPPEFSSMIVDEASELGLTRAVEYGRPPGEHEAYARGYAQGVVEVLLADLQTHPALVAAAVDEGMSSSERQALWQSIYRRELRKLLRELQALDDVQLPEEGKRSAGAE